MPVSNIRVFRHVFVSTRKYSFPEDVSGEYQKWRQSLPVQWTVQVLFRIWRLNESEENMSAISIYDWAKMGDSPVMRIMEKMIFFIVFPLVMSVCRQVRDHVAAFPKPT